MKFVRYGKAGAEKPGMIGPDGKIRDLSGHISELSGKALAPSSLKNLAGLTDLPTAMADVAFMKTIGSGGTVASRRPERSWFKRSNSTGQEPPTPQQLR